MGVELNSSIKLSRSFFFYCINCHKMEKERMGWIELKVGGELEMSPFVRISFLI